MFAFLRQWNWRHVAAIVMLGMVVAFQARQLLAFNPYWGYDGGAHVQYLETLLFERRFPTLDENYLAWHEPLYYVLLVGIGLLGIPFQASHLLVLIAIDVVLFALLRRVGLSVFAAVLTTVAIVLLPAFQEVGLYYTNEALNYVFLLALMYFGVALWQEKRWSWRTTTVFALVAGLAVVTKITALVALGVCAILLVIKMLTVREWRYAGTMLLAAMMVGLCYTPWLAVRSEQLPNFSVNNYAMLPPKPFVVDERVQFLTTFDGAVFTFPFWYAGGTGFWSMLYADIVSDYYGLFENQDVLLATAEENKVLTTHNATYVSAYRKPLAQWALVWGVVPVATILFGFCAALSVFLRHPLQRSLALPVLGFSSALLVALVYHAFRYPYYDHGVVKSIFIAPAFVLPIAFAARSIARSPYVIRAVWCLAWAVYAVLAVRLFWIA